MQSSFDGDGNGFMTRDELREAFTATSAQYVLPHGYSVSVESIFRRHTRGTPMDAEFENGAEHTIFGFLHMCAWGQVYLDAQARGDPMTQATAMDQLVNVTLNVPTFTSLRDTLEERIASAQLGDSSDLARFIDTNCDWSTFDATPTAQLTRVGDRFYGC